MAVATVLTTATIETAPIWTTETADMEAITHEMEAITHEMAMASLSLQKDPGTRVTRTGEEATAEVSVESAAPGATGHQRCW